MLRYMGYKSIEESKNNLNGIVILQRIEDIEQFNSYLKVGTDVVNICKSLVKICTSFKNVILE